MVHFLGGGGYAKTNGCLGTAKCMTSAASAAVQEFPPPVLVSSNAEFDFFCDV